MVARVGGEEFALLLPGTELRDALALADQLCKKISSTPMDLTSIGLPMTSSFGVATLSTKDTTLDDMVRRADRAHTARLCYLNFVDIACALGLALLGAILWNASDQISSTFEAKS